jgi:hypothetical protein
MAKEEFKDDGESQPEQTQEEVLPRSRFDGQILKEDNCEGEEDNDEDYGTDLLSLEWSYISSIDTLSNDGIDDCQDY